MKSIRIAVYCAIVIAFARKLLAKVSKPPCKEKRYYYDGTPKHVPEMTQDWNLDIPEVNMSPRGLADAIAVALGGPKDRFRLIGGETPNLVQVAFKDKNLADEIAKRMWQSMPTFGNPNAFKTYSSIGDAAKTQIKVYRDTRS
ncbi:MAG: hypothetical protein IKA48_00800 [Fibrobacter sp.]|nr:hypothetical protein [Fibrobacter sp.]